MNTGTKFVPLRFLLSYNESVYFPKSAETKNSCWVRFECFSVFRKIWKRRQVCGESIVHKKKAGKLEHSWTQITIPLAQKTWSMVLLSPWCTKQNMVHQAASDSAAIWFWPFCFKFQRVIEPFRSCFLSILKTGQWLREVHFFLSFFPGWRKPNLAWSVDYVGGEDPDDLLGPKRMSRNVANLVHGRPASC